VVVEFRFPVRRRRYSILIFYGSISTVSSTLWQAPSGLGARDFVWVLERQSPASFRLDRPSSQQSQRDAMTKLTTASLCLPTAALFLALSPAPTARAADAPPRATATKRSRSGWR
jgi:hypothetical protein